MYSQDLIKKWYLAYSMISTLFGPITESTFLPLPTDWETLCPYTDFCSRKAAQTIKLTHEQKPCCDPCSCKPDCGLRRNCCQYSMDRYRLDEKYQTTCTSLSTAVNTFGNSQPRKLYMTVDKCPNETSCYYFQAARWGSMLPVFSHETGMIFLNKQCASCHNENHVTEWKTEVNCHTTNSRHLFHNDGLANALHGNPVEPAQCFLTFLPPKDVDVAFQSCFNEYSMWRSCASENNAANVSALCESFNATFTYKMRRFANIYCYLCSAPDGPLTKVDICSSDPSDRTLDMPFSVLLNINMIRDMDKTVEPTDNDTQLDSIDRCRPNEVMAAETGECRRLRCKSGQIELADRCEYFGNVWTAGPFQSFIRLDSFGPKDRFPVEKLDKLSSYKGEFFKNSLSRWKHWLYYAAPKDESYVAYFVLIVYHKRTDINPPEFLNEFQRSLDNIWSIKVDRKRYRMKASFHRYQNYIGCNKANDSYLMSFDEHLQPLACEGSSYLDAILSARPEQSYNTQLYYRSILLTKLLYCDQVALKPEEYNDHVDYSARIYFKITDSLLELTDFRRIPNLSGNDSIYVCLSTFGEHFWKNLTSVSMAHSSIDEKPVVFILVACLAYFISF